MPRQNRIKMSQKGNGEDFFWDKNFPNYNILYFNVLFCWDAVRAIRSRYGWEKNPV